MKYSRNTIKILEKYKITHEIQKKTYKKGTKLCMKYNKIQQKYKKGTKYW